MNKCNLIGHEWIYSIEDIPIEVEDRFGNTNIVIEPTNTKLCKNCLIKLKAKIGTGGGYDAHLNKICSWSSAKLNTAETRHKKLNELGINYEY